MNQGYRTLFFLKTPQPYLAKVQLREAHLLMMPITHTIIGISSVSV